MIAGMTIYGRTLQKSSLEPVSHCIETWYVALGTWAHHNLLK